MKVAFLRKVNQEKIVFALTIVLFVAFSLILPKFLTASNVLSLVRSVSVLGMLGLGMVIVVIGRGIDLSLVANMAISVAWTSSSSTKACRPRLASARPCVRPRDEPIAGC